MMRKRRDSAAVAGAPPLVSIVVVLYNSQQFIGPCLESIAALEYERTEVILVDNGSSDGSAERARREALASGVPCVVSRLGRNRGFAEANNRGFALSRGEILLLLNPDTEVYPDTVSELVRAFGEDGRVGVAGCKIYYPDRETLQHAGGFVRDNGLTMHYGAGERDEGQWDRPADVHYVTGAALAVRRDVFVGAGKLDPGYYPAYFEETDLCWSARRMGHLVRYVPGARVVHHESVTTGKFTTRYYYLYHRNRMRFMLKNFTFSFLVERTVPFERRWLGMIDLGEEGPPLRKAALVNVLNLPRTLLRRYWAECRLASPHLEDTVSGF